MRKRMVTANITWLRPLEVGMTFRTSDPGDYHGNDLMRITKIVPISSNLMDDEVYHKDVEHPRRKARSSKAWWVYQHCKLLKEDA